MVKQVILQAGRQACLNNPMKANNPMKETSHWVLIRQKKNTMKAIKVDNMNFSYANECGFFNPEVVGETQLTHDQQRSLMCRRFLSSTIGFPLSGMVETSAPLLFFELQFSISC